MSVVGAAVVLGAAVLVLVRLHAVRLGPALACALFGFLLGATPAGPGVERVLAASGTWLWSAVTAL